MRIFIVVTTAIIISFLMGCNPDRPVNNSFDSDLAAINEFNNQYLQAINDGDIDSLDNLTTEGHMMIASGRPPLVGKSSNIEAMRRAFELFEIDETWTPLETVIEGTLAYQRGTFTVKATPKAGGDTRTSTGNFLRIYRKQTDGSWRMIRDMFNSDQPPSQ